MLLFLRTAIPSNFTTTHITSMTTTIATTAIIITVITTGPVCSKNLYYNIIPRPRSNYECP